MRHIRAVPIFLVKSSFLLPLRERVFKKARKKLDKALKEHGYETRDQLRDAIREKITDSQQLEVFDAFRDE